MLTLESKERGRLTSSLSLSPSSSLKRVDSSKCSGESSGIERIDLLHIKHRIVEKIGAEKADKYFSYFRSFIGSRLSKHDVDKLVVLTIGKEYVGLHNQFVKAIFTNAVKGNAPPPLSSIVHSAKKIHVKPYSPCLTSDVTIPHASPSILSNGDSVLSSQLHGWAVVLHDHHKASPVGPCEDHCTPDMSRPLQLHGAAKHLDAESMSSLDHPTKRPRIILPTSDDTSPVAESKISGNEGHASPLLPFGSSMGAHLGAPFGYEVNDTGIQRETFPTFSAHLLLQVLPDKEFEDMVNLPDHEFMLKWMEQMVATKGLEGVSTESAVILNCALDTYLTRLIKLCVDISEARGFTKEDSERPNVNSATLDQKQVVLMDVKLSQAMNGVYTGPKPAHLKMGKDKTHCPLPLTNVKVAMDMDPQQLGGNWPTQLERISFRVFDSTRVQLDLPHCS